MVKKEESPKRAKAVPNYYETGKIVNVLDQKLGEFISDHADSKMLR